MIPPKLLEDAAHKYYLRDNKSHDDDEVAFANGAHFAESYYEEKMKRLVEALEFYADGMGIDCDDVDHTEIHKGTMLHRWMEYPGKKAREALKELGE